MSKIIFLMILAGLVVVAIAAFGINTVNAGQRAEFIQVSVLAQGQANYGVDEQAMAIPAVSIEIVEDAARDFQSQSAVRVITYTSLPTEEPKQSAEDNGDSETVDEVKHNNGQGNGNSGGNGNLSNNGNGNGNQNQDGIGGKKDNGKDKQKESKPKKK